VTKQVKHTKQGMLVSELEFNVPFQHKHGYIREENRACIYLFIT